MNHLPSKAQLDLLAYREAMLVIFPRGSNVRAKDIVDGALCRANDAFKALTTKHKRMLDPMRCTVDRFSYILRMTKVPL